MKKYYFISYLYRYVGPYITEIYWHPGNAVEDEKHPLEYQMYLNDVLFKNERTFIVTGWQEITKEEYERFKNDIG